MSFLCAIALQKIDVACNNHKKGTEKNNKKKNSNNSSTEKFNAKLQLKVISEIRAKGSARN